MATKKTDHDKNTCCCVDCCAAREKNAKERERRAAKKAEQVKKENAEEPYTWKELFEISKNPPKIRELYDEHGFIAIVALKLAQAMQPYPPRSRVCYDAHHRDWEMSQCWYCPIAKKGCLDLNYSGLVDAYAKLYEAQK